MENEKITPEDRFLGMMDVPSPVSKKGVFDLKKKKDWILQLKLWGASFGKKKNGLELFRLKVLNQILAGACILLTLFGIFYFYHKRLELDNRLTNIDGSSNDFSIEKKRRPYFVISLAESLSAARQRSIFNFIAPKDEEVPLTAQDISEILGNIKLVGIIWSKSNPEVMVEDESDKQTYLLREGDQLGEVTIKDIQVEKVIIEVEGKEFEWK